MLHLIIPELFGYDQFLQFTAGRTRKSNMRHSCFINFMSCVKDSTNQCLYFAPQNRKLFSEKAKPRNRWLHTRTQGQNACLDDHNLFNFRSLFANFHLKVAQSDRYVATTHHFGHHSSTTRKLSKIHTHKSEAQFDQRTRQTFTIQGH